MLYMLRHISRVTPCCVARMQDLEARQKTSESEGGGGPRVSKRAMIANLFNMSTPSTPSTSTPLPPRQVTTENEGWGQDDGSINLSPAAGGMGLSGLPPLLKRVVEQYESMRDAASSDITLHDVMRIQLERLRAECDELRSDYEALFNERKALQSLVNQGGDDNDSRQLAVELAQAQDALSTLRAQFHALLVEKEKLLSQPSPLAMPAAAAGAGVASSRIVGGGGSGGPNPFDGQGEFAEERFPCMPSNPFGGDGDGNGDDFFASGSATPRGGRCSGIWRESEEAAGGRDLFAAADAEGGDAPGFAAASLRGASASQRGKGGGGKGEPDRAKLRAAPESELEGEFDAEGGGVLPGAPGGTPNPFSGAESVQTGLETAEDQEEIAEEDALSFDPVNQNSVTGSVGNAALVEPPSGEQEIAEEVARDAAEAARDVAAVVAAVAAEAEDCAADGGVQEEEGLGARRSQETTAPSAVSELGLTREPGAGGDDCRPFGVKLKKAGSRATNRGGVLGGGEAGKVEEATSAPVNPFGESGGWLVLC